MPPQLRRPEGPFGDHYGYYSLQHDYPVFQVQRHRAPGGRDLSGNGRRQAAAGRLLHRRSAAGAAVAAVSAGDAGRRAALVVRRDRLPLARRCRRQAALQARGDGQRVPDPRRRAVVAHQVPARDRSPRRPEELPRDARAHPGAHTPRDRSLRVLQPVDGHARLHRTDGQRRIQGRVARAWRSVRELPRQFSGTAPAGVTDVRVYCGGCLVVGGAGVRVEPGAAARIAASGRSRTGRSSCSRTMQRGRRGAT